MMNQKGFTLIEIIAVLVILGILAAVAVPKYVALQNDAAAKAAMGQVAEMKSTLNMAWAKAALSAGTTSGITGAQAVTNTGFTSASASDVGTSPDKWNVTLTASGNQVTVAVNNRDGDANYNATGTWNVPN